jgi:hypothetical protein
MPTWNGATVYRSTDGATYSPFVSSGVSATWGRVSNALGAPPIHYNVWDDTNTLTVRLVHGVLSSSTDALVLEGANAFALGSAGRWMICSFVNATQNADGTYMLSRLLQGRRGTEWMCGEMAVGDTFVLLSTSSVIRRGLDLTEVDKLRYYKSVTFGSQIAAAPVKQHTLEGQDRMPYAPCQIKSQRHTPSTNDFTIGWIRRDRLTQNSGLSISPSCSETVEQYSIDILDGPHGSVKRTLGPYGTPVGLYTSTQQATDFGTAQSTIYANVYQVSAQVGRGFSGYAALNGSDTVTGAPETITPLNTNAVMFLQAYDTTDRYWVMFGNADPDILGGAVYSSINNVDFYPVSGTNTGPPTWETLYSYQSVAGENGTDRVPAGMLGEDALGHWNWGKAALGQLTAALPAASGLDNTNDITVDLSASNSDLLATPGFYEGGFSYIEGGSPYVLPQEIANYHEAEQVSGRIWKIKSSSGIDRGYGPPKLGVGTSHNAGSKFAYIKDAYATSPPGVIKLPLSAGLFKSDGTGKTFYFKVCGLDEDGTEQSLASVPSYSFTPVPAMDYVEAPGYYSVSLSGDYHVQAFTNRNTFLLYANREITIPDPASTTTYYVTVADPHYLGDYQKTSIPEGPDDSLITVEDGGSGYAVGDTGTIYQNNPYLVEATYEVDSVDGGGAVTGFTITGGGDGYWLTKTGFGFVGSPASTINDGAQPGIGSGFTIHIASLDAPVTPSLTVNCITNSSLVEQRGHIYLGSITVEPGGSYSATPGGYWPGFTPTAVVLSRIDATTIRIGTSV